MGTLLRAAVTNRAAAAGHRLGSHKPAPRVGPGAAHSKPQLCRAVPLIDLATISEGFNALTHSFEEEMVLQSTLHVPLTQALQCRVENHGGSPFAAPSLANLQDDDMDFAACMAAPPEIEEQHSLQFKRLASLLGEQRSVAEEVVENLVRSCSVQVAAAAVIVRSESQAMREERRKASKGVKKQDPLAPVLRFFAALYPAQKQMCESALTVSASAMLDVDGLEELAEPDKEQQMLPQASAA